MEIHKPKPWHGWREFLKEYAIVVVGVLTALAAEQTVEALHHRQEARETRQALNGELAFDLASFDLLLSSHDCVDRRLDELSRWAQSLRAGKPLRLTRPIEPPPWLIFRTSVWRVTSAGGVAQMPFADRIAYGQVYDSLENNQSIRQREGDWWLDLARFGPADSLTADQYLEVQGDLGRIRRANAALNGNAVPLHDFMRTLGIRPGLPPLANKVREGLPGFCAPIVAQ